MASAVPTQRTARLECVIRFLCNWDRTSGTGERVGGGPRRCRFRCTCAPATCGDNVRDQDEACDGEDNGRCRGGECRPDCTCRVPHIPGIDDVRTDETKNPGDPGR